MAWPDFELGHQKIANSGIFFIWDGWGGGIKAGAKPRCHHSTFEKSEPRDFAFNFSSFTGI